MVTRSPVMTDDHRRRSRHATFDLPPRGRARDLREEDRDIDYKRGRQGSSASPGWRRGSHASPASPRRREEPPPRRVRARSLDADQDHDRPRRPVRHDSPDHHHPRRSRRHVSPDYEPRRFSTPSARPVSRSPSPGTSTSSRSHRRRSSTGSALRHEHRSSPPSRSPTNSDSGRHSSRYYPPSSSKSSGSRRHSVSSSQPRRSSQSSSPISDPKVWMGAARCAVQAGAVAAMKVRGDPGPWVGPKGASVASAALGAAVVDTLVEHQVPDVKGGMRHAMVRVAAQSALGNLVPGKKR